MRVAVAVLVVATALGCSVGRPLRSLPPTRGAVLVASAPIIAAPQRLPLPPPLQAPTDVACLLSAASWPREPLEDVDEDRAYLRFVAGGPAFAEVFIPNHELRLRWRSARPGFVGSRRLPTLTAGRGQRGRPHRIALSCD